MGSTLLQALLLSLRCGSIIFLEKFGGFSKSITHSGLE